MKKPVEPTADIDGVLNEPPLLAALRQAQLAAVLAFEQRDRKTYLEMEMTAHFWTFRHNVPHRPVSAPAKLCPEKPKRLVRHDAFTGMEPIVLPPAASKPSAAKK